MQFGRVEGFLTRTPRGEMRITVLLDTRRTVETVRDEQVPSTLHTTELPWLADQLVQESLGNELAEDGWEVIGEAPPDAAEGSSAVARSTCYVVRRV